MVLAKNNIAKKRGVKTGSTLSDAKKVCPDVVFVPPHTDLYLKYSAMAKGIYSDYTDYIESFGIDECWLDVTRGNYDGKALADEIRGRIKKELGVTASVGVSYNKIFAKMGSDYKKPDATTVITEENFKELLWELPVSDMLFVGNSTFKKLFLYNIITIGDLARCDIEFLRGLLGKNGVLLWNFANGLDSSAVSGVNDAPPIKSIGNSTTSPRDLLTDDDVRVTLRVLSDSVASRLRANRLKCTTVQLEVRNTKLSVYSRQRKLQNASSVSDEIFDTAFSLYLENHPRGVPIRSMGVRGTNLVPEQGIQLSFLLDDERKLRREELERTLDTLRRRFGTHSVVCGVTMLDRSLSTFSPGDDHAIHPEPFMR